MFFGIFLEYGWPKSKEEFILRETGECMTSYDEILFKKKLMQNPPLIGKSIKVRAKLGLTKLLLFFSQQTSNKLGCLSCINQLGCFTKEDQCSHSHSH